MNSKRLTEICDIQYGFPFDSTQFSTTNGFPLIRIRDVVRGYTETYTLEEYKEEYVVHEGDLLIGMDGDFNIARWGKTPALLNQRVCRLLPKEEVDRSYLYYFMPVVLASISDRTAFVTVKHLSAKELNKITISLPPLDEQQKIAAELDKISNLIAKRKSQIEKLDLLVKSKFVEMFGDPVTNPMGWDTKRFLDTGNCKNGMNFGADEKGIEIQCLGVGDFKDLSVIDDVAKLAFISLNSMPSSEYLLQDEDIVFVRSNGNKNLVGRCVAVYPNKTPVTFSGFCIRYRKHFQALVTPYLLYMLKHKSVRRKMLGRGANIKNLNQQILGSLIIPIPPLPLQTQFAHFVQKTEQVKSVMQKSFVGLETLYKARMQKYFE